MAAGQTTFSLVGDLLTTCACRLGLGDAERDGCRPALVYRVTRGWVDDVDMAGRTMAVVERGPEMLIDEESSSTQLLAVLDALRSRLWERLTEAASWTVAADVVIDHVLQVPIQVRISDRECDRRTEVRSMVLSEPS